MLVPMKSSLILLQIFPVSGFLVVYARCQHLSITELSLKLKLYLMFSLAILLVSKATRYLIFRLYKFLSLEMLHFMNNSFPFIFKRFPLHHHFFQVFTNYTPFPYDYILIVFQTFFTPTVFLQFS